MFLNLPTLFRQSATLLAPALLLAACASMPPSPARLYLQLSPASLGQSLSVQQHLSVERAGQINELDTVLEIEPDHLDLVGLAFGQRVMTLHYDGKELKTWRHFMLPREVQGEDVLQDVQLTLWPAAAIRAALPADWTLEENDTQRTLRQNHEIVTQIDYLEPRKIILNNLRYRYKLSIQSAAP